MRFKFRTDAQFALVVSFILTQFAFAQEPAPQPGRGAVPAQHGGFMMRPVDPCVQRRSYSFKDGDSNQNIEYAVFVSSKVSKDKKNPLIVTLPGLGAGPTIMFGPKALELAEEGGYILAGPMGYNVRGWYGISTKGLRGAPPKPANPKGADQSGLNPAPKAKPDLFSDPKDRPKLNELSEKDVMNVLDLLRKEFDVDECRICLMGHSMGGAGTLYLGVKYPSVWAALGAIAPAAFTFSPDSLEAIPNMPVILVHGDVDESSCCQHQEVG